MRIEEDVFLVIRTTRSDAARIRRSMHNDVFCTYEGSDVVIPLNPEVVKDYGGISILGVRRELEEYWVAWKEQAAARRSRRT